MKIINQIQFPEFTGIKCNMMPFIQGDKTSLPSIYQSYSDIIQSNYLEKGEIGYLTIEESYVEANSSQRGYGASNRNVHIEVGRYDSINCWGSPTPVYSWGKPYEEPKPINSWGNRYKANVTLEDNTEVLIANNISNTCRVWDAIEKSPTLDGDLSDYLYKYPEHTGQLLQSGELAKISIFTPHECVKQLESGNRQFFRIVGKGVTGREEYFTYNPLFN